MKHHALLPATLALALSLPVSSAQAASAPDVFDRPVQVKHVRLPADPSNPTTKREVVCWSYADYMVKQLDFGEVGAERLAIVPAANGKARPCRETQEPDEYVIPVETWSGYFAGAKSGFAFFTAEDGVNSGTGFMVLRMADKKKLLDDSTEHGFESAELKAGMPVVRYRRVYSATCSVVTGGAACINEIAAATGVSKASLASCESGYRLAKESLARERCKIKGRADQQCMARELEVIRGQKWDASPSVISYKVELELRLANVEPAQAFSIKPLGDALACHPAD